MHKHKLEHWDPTWTLLEFSPLWANPFLFPLQHFELCFCTCKQKCWFSTVAQKGMTTYEGLYLCRKINFWQCYQPFSTYFYVPILGQVLCINILNLKTFLYISRLFFTRLMTLCISSQISLFFCDLPAFTVLWDVSIFLHFFRALFALKIQITFVYLLWIFSVICLWKVLTLHMYEMLSM